MGTCPSSQLIQKVSWSLAQRTGESGEMLEKRTDSAVRGPFSPGGEDESAGPARKVIGWSRGFK